jgi:alpha-L-fucosidase 2
MIRIASGMVLACACRLPAGAAAAADPADQAKAMKLWYDKPASKWVEALPIGNGRLGAMVFGRTDNERIQLNEDTLWGGGPYDPSSPEALKALPEVRRLVFEGKYREAQDLANQKMMARPIKQMPYQTVGDLNLSFPGHEKAREYRRELDLDAAVASVTYTVDGVRHAREVFASPVDQAIVLRLTADKPGAVSFTAGMSTPQKATVAAEAPGTLVMTGVGGGYQGIPGALRYQARVRILPDGGKLSAGKDSLTVAGANSATLLIVAATSYNGPKDVTGDPAARCQAYLAKAAGKPFETIRKDHLAEHRRLFRRVRLDLGTSESIKLPTDQRIAKFRQGGDPQLAALYFQFGRYLMISGSRPGCQPLNLQGIWNESLTPPWEGKYTININTEMNYWPAEPCNLAECHEPLIRMVGEMAQTGRRTARVNYGARGWVCHHNTDLWRATAPIDAAFYGLWPTGGAWLCRHLFDHYEFHPDRPYLQRIYPTLKGAAEFFLDTLVEHPKHHWLVTCPSMSPELGHPKGASTCAGPTMDMQILRDLFANTIQAAEVLGVDEELRSKLADARKRLAPMQVGRHGQLREWLEDWDDPTNQHRHLSHLYGLFPSSQITPRGTPKLFAAARRSLEFRGDGATGWSLAWKINLWARLLDGDHAHKLLATLLSPGRTYPNLFDSCPPFQIDGNFGGTSGITEMLLQSHAPSTSPRRGREIHLLPALPAAWPTGSFEGLPARGGFEVDAAWKDGKLTRAAIRSSLGGPCEIRCGRKAIALEMKPGESCTLDGSLQRRQAALEIQ